MKANEYILRKLNERDRENAETTQLEALLSVEDDVQVPEYLDFKIKKYARKYQLRYGEILGAIASSHVTAAHFSKSANKQRVAEKSQIEYINSRINGTKLETLSADGYNSVRLSPEGELVIGPKTAAFDGTKSIDAVRELRNGVVEWVYLKWTKGAGGAQDNQCTDVKKFLVCANAFVSQNPGTTDRFVAVVDGAYYIKHKEDLQSFAGPNVVIYSSDEYIAAINARRVVVVGRTRTGASKKSQTV